MWVVWVKFPCSVGTGWVNPDIYFATRQQAVEFVRFVIQSDNSYRYTKWRIVYQVDR